MRDKLVKLKSEIGTAKSTMLDSVVNAEVLNKAMLEQKLEELEIESLNKCDDEIKAA